MSFCSTLNEICTTVPQSQMLDTMKTLSGVKPRSGFAAIIAETYFIPGITGRARCLQDHCAPETVNTCMDSSVQPTASVGHYPESEPNASTWEIERLSRRRPHRGHSSVVWAKTTSFLRQPNERRIESRQNQHSRSKTSQGIDVLDSLSLSNSPSRSQIVEDDDRSEYDHGDDKSVEHAPVASKQGRLFTSVQDRWLKYQHDSHSSSRRSLLHEELESIQSLLTKQRVRLASYDTLQGNGMESKTSRERPAVPVRSSSTRSCRHHERKTRVRVTSLNSLL